MSEKDKPLGTAELGMVAVGRAAAQQPTEQEIQAGIDAAMRGVIADRWTNPNALRAPEKVKVANAVQIADEQPKAARGWVEPAKLESPMPKGSFIEGVVGGMIDRALGPAVPKKREDGGAGC